MPLDPPTWRCPAGDWQHLTALGVATGEHGLHNHVPAWSEEPGQTTEGSGKASSSVLVFLKENVVDNFPRNIINLKLLRI